MAHSPKQQFDRFNATVLPDRRQVLRKLFRANRRKHDGTREWKTRRRLRIEGDPQCFCCKSTVSLTCHHLTYARAGDEEWEDLRVLCRKCHTIETSRMPGHNRHAYADEVTPREQQQRLVRLSVSGLSVLVR